MSHPAIRVEGLSKQYRIGRVQRGYSTLREDVMSALAAPFHRIIRRLPDKGKGDTIWALKDVSFEVERGEVVGVIGQNGAGKSTLLKVLSRITEPTLGEVRIRGRVGSLLEVGTGFHPELTGRENIYLNAAILSMGRKEIRQKFDEIVRFAEIEKFIDTPVKHYSSGMHMRLAFSVAAHLEPEVLLVDEVLAVGDAAFQKKCLGKMGEVAKEGRTVLFVSHNMAAIQSLCNRSILLTAGSVEFEGPSYQVVLRYLGQSSHGRAECIWSDSERQPGNESVSIASVRILDKSGKVSAEIRSGEDLAIEVSYRVKNPGIKLGTTVVLFNQEGICVLSSMSNHEPLWHGRHRPLGNYRSTCHVPRLLLAEGQYSVAVVLWEENYRMACREDDVVRFGVADTGEVRGDYLGGWSGVVRPLLEWRTLQDDSHAGRRGRE